ncbi:MAG TPA: gamma-glutamyl-gamma-aminobutyrate hydrolase family protein [Stellaceae bacterium]|nr:gamma-glutamyl-gamma-aminobutyrate hydrolase family protein [Stellaceae bacterium]
MSSKPFHQTGPQTRPQTRPATIVVGIPCDRRMLGDYPFHVVGEKYVTAALVATGAVPFLIPAMGDRLPLDQVLERLDGLLLTGSPSNVEPLHYDGHPSAEGTEHDPDRDATTLPLIRRALEIRLPILAICRGIQELNVAMGGTLHQKVHRVAGRLDHRSDKTGTPDHRYRQVHPVSLTAGGMLAELAEADEIMVNSLHAQGIDRLADGLVVEATAPDGQIEAVIGTGGFAVGLQWHPEWHALENPVSARLFAAFRDACRDYAAAGRATAQVA